MAYPPNSEQVGVAWVKLMLDNNVATEVPEDTSTWAASGFTQVTNIGGDPEMYLPVNKPDLSLHHWAINENSPRPPWGIAYRRASIVRAASLSASARCRVSGMTGANDAVVLNVRVGANRRLPGDRGGAADVAQDLEIDWVEIA